MADQVGIQVDGARELRSSLKKAGQDLNDLHEAHQAASKIVANKGQSNAPRLTGRLAGSTRGSGSKTAAVVRAGGARVPYAGPIHWGWAARNIAPNPFLAEAAQDTESEWLPIYQDAVERVLDTIKGSSHAA